MADSGPGSEMKSVTRVAAVLACFTFETSQLALPELARLAGTSKATTHRYASALVRVGVLAYDPERQLYSVGPECLRLASVLWRTNSVQAVARPVLKRVTRELHETTTFALWLGDAPVIVLCETGSNRLIRIDVPIGSRLPHDSASGLVLQAFGALGPGVDHDLAAEVDGIRSTGVAITTNVVSGIRAIAAPVYSGPDVAGALSVVGTVASLPDDRNDPAVERLLAAAGELSHKLGAGSPSPT